MITLFLSGNFACKSQNKEVQVLITTNFGTVKLKLYNETPLHRDNFLKLIKQGYFTDKLFHRVITNFMIQGGEESSVITRDDTVEDTTNYKVPAEIVPSLYHKRGALAAARKADRMNMLRESSGNQFYIVTGERYSSTQLYDIENTTNDNQLQYLVRKYYMEEKVRKQDSLDDKSIQNIAIAKAKKEVKLHPFSFNDEQIKTYKTMGGAPHLDGAYTVFGEVTEGMQVVDKISRVNTNEGDRPIEEVKFSIKVVE